MRPYFWRTMWKRRIDGNQDGKIEKKEIEQSRAPAVVKEALHAGDTDKNGALDKKEQIAAAKELGKTIAARFTDDGPGWGDSQPQRNDPDFKPSVKSPRYFGENSPTVAVDEGHQNFHTKDGRFRPFAHVLEADGCKVVGHAGRFTKQSLEPINVLVIANALPTSIESQEIESAFGEDEIQVLKDWVRRGGSLMVLADHRPYGEAAKPLGAAFGVEMSGGFVLDNDEQRGLIVFDRENELLASHPITEGTTADERITSIMSFTGQALRLPDNFAPLMSLAEGTVRNPDRGSISESEATDVSDWYQGAVAEIGKGRVAFFGEAGMFSAQVGGPGGKMGMNAAGAEQNQRFLLNVIHWLTSD